MKRKERVDRMEAALREHFRDYVETRASQGLSAQNRERLLAELKEYSPQNTARPHAEEFYALLEHYSKALMRSTLPAAAVCGLSAVLLDLRITYGTEVLLFMGAFA